MEKLGALPIAEELPALTPEEERGLERAIASLREGRGRTLDEVRRDFRERFSKEP
jgi:hypothetical protein